MSFTCTSLALTKTNVSTVKEMYHKLPRQKNTLRHFVFCDDESEISIVHLARCNLSESWLFFTTEENSSSQNTEACIVFVCPASIRADVFSETPVVFISFCLLLCLSAEE